MTSILVTHTGAIGDTIMILPLLDYLKNQKRYEVTVIASNNSIRKIYEIYGCYDKIIDFHITKTMQLFSLSGLKLIFKLRQKKFDLAFCPFPGRGIFAVLLMMFCRCKQRAHHRYDFKFLKNTKLFLTDTADIKREHTLKLNETLLKNAGFLDDSDCIKFGFESQKVVVSEVAVEKIKSKCRLYNSGKKMVGLFPGGGDNSAFAYKRWDVYKWVELIKKLSDRHGDCTFFIFLGPGEKDICSIFESLNIKNVEVVKNLEFEKLIAFISLTSVFIGNDGGLSHIASMFGHKQITIFTKTDFNYIHPINQQNGKIIVAKDYAPVYVPYKNLVKPVGDLAEGSPSVEEVFDACEGLFL